MERVFSSPKLTENSIISKLSPVQQISYVMSRFSNKEVAELEASQSLLTDKAKKMGTMIRAIEYAMTPLKEGTSHKLLLEIDFGLLEFLREYLESPTSILNYYKTNIIYDEKLLFSKKLYLLIQRKGVNEN